MEMKPSLEELKVEAKNYAYNIMNTVRDSMAARKFNDMLKLTAREGKFTVEREVIRNPTTNFSSVVWFVELKRPKFEDVRNGPLFGGPSFSFEQQRPKSRRYEGVSSRHRCSRGCNKHINVHTIVAIVKHFGTLNVLGKRIGFPVVALHELCNINEFVVASGGGSINNGGANRVPQRPMNWKTKIHNKWVTTGHRLFGHKCHFVELHKYGRDLLDSENGVAKLQAVAKEAAFDFDSYRSKWLKIMLLLM